jgi:hypothetical protein
VNYVLGFSSIPSMPLTRQSPFTALFLRIREEKMTQIRREGGRVQVHLADLDSTFPTQEMHNQVSELTKAYRANRVEAHMVAVARARVTFGVSKAAGAKLCQPRKVNIEKE